VCSLLWVLLAAVSGSWLTGARVRRYQAGRRRGAGPAVLRWNAAAWSCGVSGWLCLGRCAALGASLGGVHSVCARCRWSRGRWSRSRLWGAFVVGVELAQESGVGRIRNPGSLSGEGSLCGVKRRWVCQRRFRLFRLCVARGEGLWPDTRGVGGWTVFAERTGGMGWRRSRGVVAGAVRVARWLGCRISVS